MQSRNLGWRGVEEDRCSTIPEPSPAGACLSENRPVLTGATSGRKLACSSHAVQEGLSGSCSEMCALFPQAGAGWDNTQALFSHGRPESSSQSQIPQPTEAREDSMG